MSASPNVIKIKDNAGAKHLSTDLMLQCFDKWHSSFQYLQKERNELSEGIQAANQENLRLTDVVQKTRNEFDVLQNTVKKSNSQLEKICVLEEEIRQLKIQSEEKDQEIENLKEQLCEERQHHRRELEQTKLEMQENLVKTTEKIKTEFTFERELLQKQIDARERDLREAEDNLKQLQKSKDAELSRVSLEYENKLARLQRMKTQSNQSQLSSVNSDIFRKKLQNMKAEYETEVCHLKFTIASLEEKLAGTSSRQPLRQRQPLSIEKRKRTV